MRPLLFLVSTLIVMGLAFWAYRENYRTQAQLDRMQSVQSQMAGLREELGVLRAEWAYLNRPGRLRDLVDMNFDRLKLVPVSPNQFGSSRNVDYPAPGAPAPDVAANEAPFVSNNRGAPPPRPATIGVGSARRAATPSVQAETVLTTDTDEDADLDAAADSAAAISADPDASPEQE